MTAGTDRIYRALMTRPPMRIADVSVGGPYINDYSEPEAPNPYYPPAQVQPKPADATHPILRELMDQYRPPAKTIEQPIAPVFPKRQR